jgi:hypothetical protein
MQYTEKKREKEKARDEDEQRLVRVRCEFEVWNS